MIALQDIQYLHYTHNSESIRKKRKNIYAHRQIISLWVAFLILLISGACIAKIMAWIGNVTMAGNPTGQILTSERVILDLPGICVRFAQNNRRGIRIAINNPNEYTSMMLLTLSNQGYLKFFKWNSIFLLHIFIVPLETFRKHYNFIHLRRFEVIYYARTHARTHIC